MCRGPGNGHPAKARRLGGNVADIPLAQPLPHRNPPPRFQHVTPQPAHLRAARVPVPGVCIPTRARTASRSAPEQDPPREFRPRGCLVRPIRPVQRHRAVSQARIHLRYVLSPTLFPSTLDRPYPAPISPFPERFRHNPLVNLFGRFGENSRYKASQTTPYSYYTNVRQLPASRGDTDTPAGEDPDRCRRPGTRLSRRGAGLAAAPRARRRRL